MFGMNPKVRPHYDKEGILQVKEIFYTIQGEGPHSGVPALFIRLANCPLACHFCDTDFQDGTEKTVNKLIEETMNILKDHPLCSLIVLTGGEPLAQNITPFIAKMVDQVTAGFTFQIETSGVCFPPELPQLMSWYGVGRTDRPAIDIVCSPKTGVLDQELVAHCHHWKFVVAAGEIDSIDGLPNHSTQAQGVMQKLFRPVKNKLNKIYVMPRDDYNQDKNAANLKTAVASSMTFGYRLIVQLHKIAGLK